MFLLRREGIQLRWLGNFYSSLQESKAEINQLSPSGNLQCYKPLIESLLKLSVSLAFKELHLIINTIPKCKPITSFGVQLKKWLSFL